MHQLLTLQSFQTAELLRGASRECSMLCVPAFSPSQLGERLREAGGGKKFLQRIARLVGRFREWRVHKCVWQEAEMERKAPDCMLQSCVGESRWDLARKRHRSWLGWDGKESAIFWKRSSYPRVQACIHTRAGNKRLLKWKIFDRRIVDCSCRQGFLFCVFFVVV